MENSPVRSSIDVGSVIAGTYIIEALIGRGGMGAVFLASHNRLPGKKVAIKVLHAELGGDEINARFKREAEIASMLSHPNIVHIEDYNVTAEGMPYLVLEYLQGESLAQRVRHGPMTYEAMAPVIRQIGSALAAAHAKGITHRDLKPQNIFLMPSEIDGRTMEIAKVLDFGISKMRDSQTVKTQDNALLGTPQYMAPEQALGQHDKIDERTDIFALGAIVYEMLSGQPAFSGQTIPEVVFKVVYEAPIPLATRVPTLSEHVTAAVQRALAKPADERFPTVTAFLEALTGSPVSLIRNPPSLPPPAAFDGTGPTSASGHTPNTDAFARTMGSGDHGASPIAASAMAAPRTTTPAPLVDQNAVTLASQDGRIATPNLGVAKTVAAPTTSGSRRRLFIAAGVIAAVATAGIVYAVTRQPPAPRTPVAAADTEPHPEPNRGSAVVPPVERELLGHGSADAANTGSGSAGSNAPIVAAGSGSGSGSGSAAKPKPKPPEHTAAPAANDDDDEGGDSPAAKKLQEATAALDAHEWKVAGQAATHVTTSEGTTDRQKQRAFMLLGMVACQTNDEEQAAGSLRSVKMPRFRARLLSVCHAQGYLSATKR